MADLSRVVAVHTEKTLPPVLFEVSEVAQGGDGWRDVNIGDPGAAIGAAATNMEQVVERVRPIAEAIVAGVRAMGPHAPEAIEVSLGIKLSAEVGFFVAKSQGEASLGLKLSWKNGT